MPISSELQSTFDDIKKRNPELEGASDEFLYGYAKEDSPGLSWDEQDKRTRKSTANTSPQFLNAFQEWFDYGIDKDSYGWMKAAYNNSLTGLTEELVTGKPRHDLKDYDPNILEDIGSMALSFLMPLDMLTLAVGGGIAKGATIAKRPILGKGLSGLAKQGIEKRISTEFGKRAWHKMIPAAVAQGTTLGVYEGAMGGVQAALNDEDVMAGIGKGVIHGGILGGAAGAAGGGLMWKNANLLSKFEGQVVSAADKAKLIATGMPGQIVTESATFTAFETGETILDPERDVKFRDVITSFGKNLGLFSLLKGQSKFIERGKKHANDLIATEKRRQVSENAKAFMSAHDSLMAEAKEAREKGDIAEADAIEVQAKALMEKHDVIDGDYQSRLAETREHRDRLDRISKGELEATPENLMDIIDGLNGIIGVTERLRGEGKIYEGLEGELNKQENIANDLLTSITNPHVKPVKKVLKKVREAKPLEVEATPEIMAKEVKTPIKEFNKQTEHVKKELPDVAPRMGKNVKQGLFTRISGQAGLIAKGATNLAKSLSSDVAPHVVKMLKKFKSETSNNLLAEGKKRFGGERGLNKTLNDLAAGNLKGQKKAQAEAWVEKFWNNTNHELGWFTPQDVIRASKGEVKSEVANPPQKELTNIDKSIQRIEGQLESIGLGKGTRIINNVREQIFGKVDYNLKDATYGQLDAYREFLASKHKEYSPVRDKNFKDIRKLQEKANISEELSKEYLDKMGVKEGKLENASKETLEQYASLIKNNHDVSLTGENSVDFIHNLENKNFKEGVGKLIERAFTPVWKVLKDYKLDKIAEALLGHETTDNVVYRGPGEKVLHEIKKTLGMNKRKFFGKMSDISRIERILMRKAKVEDYTPAEIKRLEKEFDVKLTKAEIKKLVKEYTKEGELSKEELEFFENMKKEGTIENDAWKLWTKHGSNGKEDGLADFYWKAVPKELMRHGLTKKNAEALAKELESKHVQGYMYRRLTKKALERFDLLTKDNTYVKDLVNQNLKNAALKQAKIDLEGKSKEAIDAKAKELRKSEDFQDRIAREILTAMQYGFANVKNHHLIERGALLPEYINLPKKNGTLERVKVYESSFDATAGAYVSNMSKYLASLRHLPEWTGLGTKYGLGSNSRAIVEGMERDRSIGGYAVKSIKRQLGLDRSELLADNRPLWKWVGRFTNLSAMTGLSSPLSGIKNTLIGIPRAAGDFGLINTARGIGHFFFNPLEARRVAREKGYLDYGQRTLQLDLIGSENFNMKRLFNFNLMTTTEGFNRIVSAHAGRLYFNQAKAVLRGEPGMFRMGTNKKRMRRLMEDLYKLNKSEIDLIENTKQESPHERSPELQKQLDAIHQKVEHYSHLSSQGGTSTVMLPLWMSSKEGRPLTLFQRMAMSTTIDSYHNFVKPIKEFGNIMPLARAAMGHTVSGAALYWIYDELLGKEPPTGSALSQSDAFDKTMMNLWRSEFLGVFGEILSPYDRELGIPIMQPVILRNLGDAAEQFYQVAGGGKTLGQATKDYVKNTVVVYSQFGEQLPKVLKSDYYEKTGRVKAMARKFKKERGMPSFHPQGLMSRRQPYYRKLKEAFMFGKDADIGREYWKAYDFIVTDLEQRNPYTTPQKRSKDAKRALKTVLSHYNPLNLSDDPKGTKRTIKKQFYDWLDDENVEMAKSIEREYQYRMRKYNRTIANPKYKRQYSVYPYL